MTLRRVAPAAVAALTVSFVGLAPAGAYPRPGATEIINLAWDGAQADGVFGFSSEWPALTPDGRYVAFHSVSPNLVPGDSNSRGDIFFRDTVTGDIELISIDHTGESGNHDSWAPRVTPDGRFVAFESWGSLLPGDDGWADVFVRDRALDVTERISLPHQGTLASESSFHPAISDDGRWVAFDSYSPDIVPNDTNALPDVFLHDRATDTTTRVSVTSDGAQANSGSAYATMSGDGRYIAFVSTASNLVLGDRPGTYDNYVHDRLTGETFLVSQTPSGGFPNGGSFNPRISADGSYVSFSSEATDLVPHDANGSTLDVYGYDIATGGTERLNVASDGREADGYTSLTAMSTDGRYTMFWSDATNLVPGDTNDERDVFLHDRYTGSTELVSETVDPAGGNAMSWGISSVTPDGRFAAFMSEASNIVTGDINGAPDIFLRDRGPQLGVSGLQVIQGEAGLEVRGRATFSGDVIASAVDPVDAARPGLSGELRELKVIARPEAPDLLISWDLEEVTPAGTCLPFAGCTPAISGTPLTMYGLSFTVAGVRYEIRGTRDPVPGLESPDSADFALYRCAEECIEVPGSGVSGSIGTTGSEARAMLPLDRGHVSIGDELTDIEAFTEVGEGIDRLDTITVGSIAIPAPSLGIALAGAGGGSASGPTLAELIAGVFTVQLENPGAARQLRFETCFSGTCAERTHDF